MNSSLFSKYVWPFMQWFALMVFMAIALDYFFHRFHLFSVGRYLGYAGTAVILASFIYSLRKRKIITNGSPKKLLVLHEYMAWAGSVMILVHAGIHFNALLPWLATIMLLVAVASGLVGKFLLKKANQDYRDKLQSLLKTGMGKKEAEKILFFDAITVEMMKKWRAVHIPISVLLAVLSLLHILSIVLFAR